MNNHKAIFALIKLQSIHDRLLIVDDEGVFVDILNEFYTELTTNPAFQQVLLVINQKYNDLIFPLHALEADALEEMENIFLEIKEFANHNSLKSAWLLDAFEKFHDPSKYQSVIVWNKFIAINMVMIALYNIPGGRKYKYALKPAKIRSVDTRYYEQFKKNYPFSKYWEWHEKKLAFDSMNEVRECKSLKKIEDFFNCSNAIQYGKLRDVVTDKGYFYQCYQSFSVGGILGIPRSYYDTEFQAPRRFLMDEFKQHAGRVFFLIQNILEPKYKFSFFKTNGKFKYNEKEIIFKQRRASWVVLSLLVTDKGPKKNKTLKSESVRDKILKQCDSVGNEPDLYEICRTINKRISKEFGLQEFIIFENETIRINPLYLD